MEKIPKDDFVLMVDLLEDLRGPKLWSMAGSLTQRVFALFQADDRSVRYLFEQLDLHVLEGAALDSEICLTACELI